MRLPVHGFVLAGGKSSRMGVDKALLSFCGRPMVEIAVEKLRSFCAAVSIAGNRDDLCGFAPVVHEMRLDAGPGAGIEAGLKAAQHKWVVFVPVDVPLVPAGLLRSWVEDGLAVENDGVLGSYLTVDGQAQPAFCLIRREALGVVSGELVRGERRLLAILAALNGKFGGKFGEGAMGGQDAARFAPVREDIQMERWFSNVNTPEDLAAAEGWAKEMRVKA